MNRYVQHIPSYCDAKPKVIDFKSINEILDRYDHLKGYRFYLDEDTLMGVCDDGFEWHVLGYIDDVTGIDLPKFEFKYRDAAKRRRSARKYADLKLKKHERKVKKFRKKMIEFSNYYKFKSSYKNYFLIYKLVGSLEYPAGWHYTYSIESYDPSTVYLSNEDQAKTAVNWFNKHYPDGLL